MTGDNAYAQFAQGAFLNTTTAHLSVQHPVQMRTSPHTFEWTTSTVLRDYTTDFVVTGAGFDYSSSTVGAVYMTIASGGTLYRPCFARANGTTAAFFGFSAEL